MNYKDFKNGDVIKIFDYNIGKESITISIVNKVELGTDIGDRIYTYADLDMDSGYLSVEKDGPGCSYIPNHHAFKFGFELATEEEKNKLFEKLFVLYTEVYNPVWDKHSLRNFFEIQGFLFDIFCIKVEEYDDHLIYPKFVDNIVDYILCRGFEAKENRDWNTLQLPWTIQDAKDGDVIFYDDGWTCIFKCIHGIWYSSYCFIDSEGEFHTGYERHAVDSTINGNAHPATKEQCNLLFQKIKEAGYKWNPKNKTLERLPNGFEEESTDTLVSLEKIISETIKYFGPILKTHYSDEYSTELINGFINNITGTGINKNNEL